MRLLRSIVLIIFVMAVSPLPAKAAEPTPLGTQYCGTWGDTNKGDSGSGVARHSRAKLCLKVGNGTLQPTIHVECWKSYLGASWDWPPYECEVDGDFGLYLDD